jgi:glycogen operon protein
MDSGLVVLPGQPHPLGASVDAKGVNFAIASQHAQSVTLCLFDSEAPERESARLVLHERSGYVFHAFVPNLPPTTLYAYRIDGPWDPQHGHRFNPNKLVMDPYARAFTGKPDWSAPLFGHRIEAPELLDGRDSAPGVPRCVVVADEFDWQGDRPPAIPWRKMLIYEAHVKGLTKLHPVLPEHLRGTYAGLAHPAVLKHLVELGVTSLELLPVHEHFPEGFLEVRGLTNYWGYNTLGFFAPDQRYAAKKGPGEQVREFKEMVRALHAAGIEVILDVVYNHSCEGNEEGPTISFRGIDNATYYWLDAQDRRRYRDFTGCGNSLAAWQPMVLKLILDSLRYWVQEMHVDGFRFDLATTLARAESGDFSPISSFFVALHQDPVLSQVKLIAEPWDLGPHGYRLGSFPMPFAAWNDRYRSTLRRFWRGDSGQLAELGSRLTGSSDFFKASGRRPFASINFIACHDGFTLADLVSYEHKHNEANGEENRDGTDDNQSANCGNEGPSNDESIVALREQRARNLLASLFLSVGTPMLLAGDELGRSQRGNNNAYCQDNSISWIDWNLSPAQERLLDFVRRLAKFRAEQPTLQRREFFHGESLHDSRHRDLVWFHFDGRELSNSDWQNPELRTFGMFLGGDAIITRDRDGQRLLGDTLLIYFNASRRDSEVVLPPASWGKQWEIALSTAATQRDNLVVNAGESALIPTHSLVVLRLREEYVADSLLNHPT